jgi:hypothetical protein
MNDHTGLWLTLLPLLNEEDLIRLMRRAQIKLPESNPARSDLIDVLEAELLSRDAVRDIEVPRLTSLYE